MTTENPPFHPHVSALLKRVLRSNGEGREYPTTIKFERGAVPIRDSRALRALSTKIQIHRATA